MTVKAVGKKNATFRQKRAIDILVEKGGSVGSAMIEAGYSPRTAKTPQKLTESDAWKESIGGEYLSMDSLSRAHQELLDSKRFEYFVFPKTMSDEEITEKVNDIGVEVVNISEGEKGKYAFYKIIDPNARKSALDMAYKLKGSYAPEKNVNLNVEIADDSSVKELTQRLNHVYRGTSVESDGGVASALGTEVQN